MSGERLDTISETTRDLLIQNEGEHLDFKRTPDGVTAEDLVAFANTPDGGTILVGVNEEREVGKTQEAKVFGCDVSDSAILQIVNKAVSCIPPINIMTHIENLGGKPILRLVVSHSETRPHCTSKGTYCRRDGSRNRALHPHELLQIFLDKEARAFTDRFEAAATRISKDLSKLENSLETSIDSMGDKLGWAEYQLGDTESTLDNIQARLAVIQSQTTSTETRTRILFRQDKRDDPVKDAAREEWLNKAVEYFVENEESLDQIRGGKQASCEIQGKITQELTEEEIRSVLMEAIELAEKKVDAKRYKIVTKQPTKASEKELDSFASLVQKGGEVAEGLRGRLESALVLGFITFKGKMVGTAALKKPNAVYRADVFRKAGSTKLDTSYPYELGWVYLEEAHRRRKRVPLLIEAVMGHVQNSNIFSTTRSSNNRMIALLERQKFVRNGSPYKSQQHPDEYIELFLRHPSVNEDQ